MEELQAFCLCDIGKQPAQTGAGQNLTAVGDMLFLPVAQIVHDIILAEHIVGHGQNGIRLVCEDFPGQALQAQPLCKGRERAIGPAGTHQRREFLHLLLGKQLIILLIGDHKPCFRIQLPNGDPLTGWLSFLVPISVKDILNVNLIPNRHLDTMLGDLYLIAIIQCHILTAFLLWGVIFITYIVRKIKRKTTENYVFLSSFSGILLIMLVCYNP